MKSLASPFNLLFALGVFGVNGASLISAATLQRLGMFFTPAGYRQFHLIRLVAVLSIACYARQSPAATLGESDREAGDFFGSYSSVSGNASLVSAPQQDQFRGATYYFPGLANKNSKGGVFTESVKLVASDSALLDYLGPCSLFGSTALVGAPYYNLSRRSGDYFDTGGAYLYRHLDTATGTVTEAAKLMGSDLKLADSFGYAVSLDGNIGVVAALGAGPFSIGVAYVFRNLDTATGTIMENARLVSSEAIKFSSFASSVSLSGTTALVGSGSTLVPGDIVRGAAYLYRGLDTATGTTTEDAKLVNSDAREGDQFARDVSLSGDKALVGAEYAVLAGDTFVKGAAYLYRGLKTATGTVTEVAKLSSSDTEGRIYYYTFGGKVSLSGNNALVSETDLVHLFCGLDSAVGTVTETVKIYSSGSEIYFGSNFSLEGDTFVIGQSYTQSDGFGRAFTGSVSSLTTLDSGRTFTIDAFSFYSRTDWIVGQTTSSNKIVLAAGNSGDVTGLGKSVFIGKNAGSDTNLLDIAGTLNCLYIYIGSTAGNIGNALQAESTGNITATALRLAKGNRLLIAGTPAAAQTFLKTAPLQVFVGNGWKTVTTANYKKLVGVSQSGGYTVIVPL